VKANVPFLFLKKPISGRFGNGPVDFAIEYRGALMMITEAKKKDPEMRLHYLKGYKYVLLLL